jgi:hypothetical protein
MFAYLTCLLSLSACSSVLSSVIQDSFNEINEQELEKAQVVGFFLKLKSKKYLLEKNKTTDFQSSLLLTIPNVVYKTSVYCSNDIGVIDIHFLKFKNYDNNIKTSFNSKNYIRIYYVTNLNIYVVEHYGKDTQVYVFEKLDDVLEVIPFNVAKDLYFLNDLYLRGYKKGELFEENAFKENSTLYNNDNNVDKVSINDKVLFGDESNFSSGAIRLFDEVTSYCNRMIEHLKIRLKELYRYYLPIDRTVNIKRCNIDRTYKSFKHIYILKECISESKTESTFYKVTRWSLFNNKLPFPNNFDFISLYKKDVKEGNYNLDFQAVGEYSIFETDNVMSSNMNKHRSVSSKLHAELLNISNNSIKGVIFIKNYDNLKVIKDRIKRNMIHNY